MAPVLLAVDGFEQEQRDGIERHRRAKLLVRARANAVFDGFLVANDSAWNVPTGAVELIVAPREQRPMPIVLDEKIDVQERRDPADEQEDVRRQALVRVTDRRFQ